MAKLINDPNDVVTEGLEGLALTQPGMTLLEGRTIAVRTDHVVTDANRADLKVAVISGGGAGHEPAHAGYVARGMLTAAVSGEIFSSPSTDAVLDGIRAVTGDAGCLLVVKNYTGDVLNFGLAADVARAEGLAVEMVVVSDDVALGDSDSHAGRRGLAGTVLVHKCAGAAAEAGRTLDEVAEIAWSVASGVRTMGVGFSAGTLPGSGTPSFDLPAGEMELGLGIHGERGVARVPLVSGNKIVDQLAGPILADLGQESPDEVVVVVGTAGATPPLELAIATRAAYRAISDGGRTVERLWQGPVMTSLDMAGISLTVLPVDAALLELLDAPTDALAWPGGTAPAVPDFQRLPVPESPQELPGGEPDPQVRAAVDATARAILNAEPELTRLDQVVGDGDLGAALSRGANAWLADPIDGSPAAILTQLSRVLARSVGGTSGPLYGSGLLAAAESLDSGGTWPEAFAAGVAAVQRLGGAEPGDKTMVDALVPAAEAAPQGLAATIDAAREGTEQSAQAVASKGRASYLGERARGEADPGAVAVVIWLQAIADSLDSPTRT